MNKRLLGNTGLEVSELGLGGVFVSRLGAEYAEAEKAVHRAVDLGINFVDTAPGYLDSEEVLGNALEDVDQPVIISTKLGGRPKPFHPQDPECLMRSVHESLHLLKREYIDILLIHEPDRPGQYDWWTDWDEFNGPVLELMEHLRSDGVIRHTGLAGTTAYEMARIIRSGKFDVVLTAFNYNLLWREAEREIIPAAKEQGMGIIIGSPLQQGALARRYDEEIENGAPWLSSSRREQYSKLYRLLDETEDVLERLDEIAAMVPFRPCEEPFYMPFTREYRGPGVAGR